MLIGKLYRVDDPAKLLAEIGDSIARYNQQLGHYPDILIIREDMADDATLAILRKHNLEVRSVTQGCQPGHFMLMMDTDLKGKPIRQPRIFTGKRIAWPK